MCPTHRVRRQPVAWMGDGAGDHLSRSCGVHAHARGGDRGDDALPPELYANPSGSHRFARRARQAIDESRDIVAEVVGCRPNEVVFTGCGTESDNMAIAGAVSRLGGMAVCPAVEHHAVLHVVEHLGGVVVGVDDAGAWISKNSRGCSTRRPTWRSSA